MEKEKMQNQTDDSPEFQENMEEPRTTNAEQKGPQKASGLPEKMGMREKLRGADTKKKGPPRKAPEPQVNPATVALRKQYVDIQSKIAPAKPAAQRIRWTLNLPIPPPDNTDASYSSAEDRLPEGFSTPPRVSEEEKRKRKREEARLLKEEMEADEALDTEVLRKPKRGGKRLNELETAMVAAGMYPEDPDGKTGRGRGKGKEEKRMRPWEEKGKKGRGRGGSEA